jgi:hypothetical protein
MWQLLHGVQLPSCIINSNVKVLPWHARHHHSDPRCQRQRLRTTAQKCPEIETNEHTLSSVAYTGSFSYLSFSIASLASGPTSRTAYPTSLVNYDFLYLFSCLHFVLLWTIITAGGSQS